MSESIFISYRRLDEPAEARLLRKELSAAFGRSNVFMDIAIEPGADFRKTLSDALGQCDTLLAVIGPRWIELLKGKNTIEHDDYVAYEIKFALDRKIRIVPVLVNGATMPKPSDLPGGMTDFAYMQACKISHENWDNDVAPLIAALRPTAQVEVSAAAESAVNSKSIRALVFTHDSGLTIAVSNEISDHLARLGIAVESFPHRDRSRPNAVFFSEDAPVDVVRLIIGLIGNDITHIFPIDYSTKSSSEMFGVTMAAGLMANFEYYSGITAARPYTVTQSELRWLVEPGLKQSVFLERLRYLAPPRAART